MEFCLPRKQSVNCEHSCILLLYCNSFVLYVIVCGIIECKASNDVTDVYFKRRQQYMGTAQLVFAEELPEVTGTENHVRPRSGSLGAHMPPEVAHIEVAQYPPQSGLLTGSDISHVTPKGFPWVRTCATRSWGFPPFFPGVFGYDVQYFTSVFSLSLFFFF